MIRTIIVEDDLMVAAIDTKYAERTKNIRVAATFHNGNDAWEFIQENDIDLIILDLYMPGLSGLELLQQIRQNGIHTDVIMITAANDSASITTALELGILDYLVKPFEYERFAAAIEKYILKHRMMQNNLSFSQKDIDELFEMHRQHHQSKNDDIGIAKGLQKKTLTLIMDTLKKHAGEYISSEALAEETSLSKVTIRRYMNYLISEETAESTIDYGTGVRPSILYRIL